MLAGINSISRSISLTYHALLEKMVCVPATSSCHLNECMKCPNSDSMITEIENLFHDNFVENVTFSRWTNTDHRSTLESVTVATEEFVEKLKEELVKLKVHDFIAKEQSSYMHNKKSSLQHGEFIVIADFAENYAFLVQDSIQSFRWNNNQGTVHPFVIYYKVNNELKHISFVIISEDLHHDTVAVYLFQKKLILKLKEIFGGDQIKKLIYFTDGSAAQYKNKSNFVNITHHKADFNIEIEWNFFATSHGKGPCDGVGGTLKRLATRASLQRTNADHILTAMDLYEWAKKSIKTMIFDFCTTTEYNEVKQQLEQRFDKALTIKGTRQFHSFIPETVNIMQCKFFSNSEEVFTRKCVDYFKL